MAKNVGKIFEDEVRKYLKADYPLVIRLADILLLVKAKRITSQKPCDFVACDRDGYFIAIECKATRSDVFSFGRIEGHQAEALKRVASTEHGRAYLALNFRDVKAPGCAWLIPWGWWLDFTKRWPKKSIRRKEAEEEFWKFGLARVPSGWIMPNAHGPRLKLT